MSLGEVVSSNYKQLFEMTVLYILRNIHVSENMPYTVNSYSL
jgi:hypothetical protein